MSNLYENSTKTNYLLILQACLALLIGATIGNSASAQNVISDLSEHEVPIEWDFQGKKILLFGAIDNDQLSDTNNDVIIAIKGPDSKVTARKKDRVAGIWINNDSATLKKVPSYVSIVSNRPIADIAPKNELARLKLGLSFIARDFKATDNVGDTTEEQFEDAIVRIRKKEGLYIEEPYGVTITANRLFRANISLSAHVPVGHFKADVYLFSDGKLVSRQRSSLNIHKHGIERTITTLAFDYPFLYGIICVIIALSAGLSASLVAGKR